MKTRFALILAAAAILTGCASPMTAPAQSFRPRGADSAVSITGSIDPRGGIVVDYYLTVSINGSPSAHGSIGVGNGDISGSWSGKPVLSLCNRSSISSIAINCRVVIDGEFAGTLTLTPGS